MDAPAPPVPPDAGTPLQFERAEFATPASGQTCAVCKTSITDTYFALGGAVVCPSCSERLMGRAGGRATFLRAWLWGGAAAVLGTIVWFAIVKLTGMELGLVAVAVGYAVGLAVRRGSYGRGGWKYQLLAMFLTYASIVSSYVPFVIKGLGEAAKSEHAVQQAKDGVPKDGVKKDDGTPEATAAREEERVRAEAGKPKQKLTLRDVALAVVVVFAIAFVSPFLAITSNFMGLIIIAIALYEAWKLNRRVPVTGPFRVGGALAAADVPVGTT